MNFHILRRSGGSDTKSAKLPAVLAILFLGTQWMSAQSASPQDAVTHNAWSTGAPIPVPVETPATAVLGNEIYVIGGSNAGSQPISDVQIYSPASNTWKTGPSFPTPTSGACAAVIQGVLYVFGGSNDSEYATKTVSALSKGKWTKVAAMHTARVGAEAVVENNIVYVMDGANGSSGNPNPLKTVESYNPQTDMWTEEKPMSETKFSFAAGLLKTTIIAADGAVSFGVISGDTEGYDASENAWTTEIPDPLARAGPCFGVIGDNLYVDGGYLNNGYGAAAAAENEAFNLPTNAWNTLTPMPQGAMFLGSAAYGGKLYCISGWSAFGGPLINDVQIYQP